MGALRRRKTYINGAEIAYFYGGKGPLVVLLHGFGVGSVSLMHIASLLSENFSVAVPDIPGHGESSPLNDPSFESVSKAISGFIDSLGENSFHLFGFSMGGALAIKSASFFQNRVKSLILCAPYFTCKQLPNFFVKEGIFRKYLVSINEHNRLGKLMYFLFRFVIARFLFIKLRKTLNKRDRKTFKEIMNMAMGGSPNAERPFFLLSLLLDLTRIDLINELENIKSDTLVIYGDRDFIFPEKFSLVLSDKLESSHCIKVKGASHAFVISRYKEVYSAIKKFLLVTRP